MPKQKLQSVPHLPSALVAGAAGFIGSQLCETLLAQNCRVYAVDNWISGKKANLKNLFHQPNFIFLEQDLDKPFSATIPKVDYIFHLAGFEAYVSGRDLSLETLLVNSLGTRELLEIAKKQSSKFLLVSNADLFSGFLSSTDLAHYFGSNQTNEEIYSHHEAKRFSEALVFEYLNRYQLDARIVRLGFAYGPGMNLTADGEINRLLLAVKQAGPLKIFGQGLQSLYPTYITDIVYGLTKAMFSQSSQARIFTLINPQKTTVLNLTYKLKQVLPDKNLSIEFVPAHQEETDVNLSPEILESQEELGWTPKVSFDQGILATIKWLEGGQAFQAEKQKSSEETISPEPLYTPEELGIKPAPPPTKTKPVKPPFKFPKITFPKINFNFFRPKKAIKLSLRPHPIHLSRRHKYLLLFIVLLVLYFFAPPTLLLISGTRAASSLKQIAALPDFSQVNQMTKLSLRAQKNFDASRSYLSHSRLLASIIGGPKLISNLDGLLFIGSKLSQGAVHLAKTGEAGTILAQIIFQHQDGNISQALKDIQLNLDQAYTEFSFVESELQSGRESASALLTPLTLKLQTLTTSLPSIRDQINQGRTLLPLIPGFIAQDSKKVYLLLFQNSSELRPTGGFIGSYGLLTFEKGKLLDFVVEDIYSADGQLKGYVQPPQPIAKFLGQNTWYFRDSNWDPDFPISAQRAEWFLGKTTNRNVDGVIAVNLPAVKEMLRATGPITLPDYNEEVTADNLFERAEYHSEIDFFPGSTQKKDFLGALAREIFTRMKNSSPQDLLKFSQAFENSLAQKQLLIYLHDADSQKLLLQENWSGALYSPQLNLATKLPVTSDYSYLVEANLGINKANYFLKRLIRQELTILKTKEILAVTSIDYQNQSPADAWPGGIYRSYLREYLPQGTVLISVKMGDNKLNLKDVDQETINDKFVIGFPVTVPVKNSLKVEITYRLTQPLNLTNRQGRLALVIPKQPGIIDDQLEAIINYPSFLSVTSINPVGQISPQVVTFKSDMSLDRIFTVDFTER
ncbi:MAG: DUF4012 domain-containing protein [Candidatus Beckwithbacteria bacterium]|nr:DUF4012 domain-containing protein [Candidatus Beckwithbacteria bacterium]